MTISQELATEYASTDDTMATAAKPQMPPEVRNALVREFARRLSAAGLDRAQFDPVLDELKARPALLAADVVAIAHIYVGGGTKAGSKAAALKAITTRFVERVRAEAKGRIADKATPW